MGESAEDILNESLTFLGGEPVIDKDSIKYGPLNLNIPPKEGKANTLLADHLFSPALYLAERIERGLLPVSNRTVIELGAGCGLPSLLMATVLDHPSPSLVVVTDYPDANIIGNLKKNVEQNKPHYRPGCFVECIGYEWGTNADVLLDLLPVNRVQGFDVMILSDLLHFHTSHDALITSVQLLLSKSEHSRVHVSAGNYTHRDVCSNFILKSRHIGLVFEEIHDSPEEAEWNGGMEVSGLDRRALSVRKAACHYWIGRWVNSNSTISIAN